MKRFLLTTLITLIFLLMGNVMSATAAGNEPLTASFNVEVSVNQWAKIGGLEPALVEITDGGREGTSNGVFWHITANTDFIATFASDGSNIPEDLRYLFKYYLKVNGYSTYAEFEPGGDSHDYMYGKVGYGYNAGIFLVKVGEEAENWYELPAGEYTDVITITIAALDC